MKHLKLVLFAVGAMLFSTAISGVSTTMATQLCGSTHTTYNLTTCNSTYPYLTSFEHYNIGTVQIDAAYKKVECKRSSMPGNISSSGWPGSPVIILNSGLTFSECNCSVNTLEAGSLLIEHISGTSNGTVSGLNQKIQITCNTILGSVTCTYATKTWTHFGEMTVGWFPQTSVNAKLVKYAGSSFLCDEPVTWTAKYEVIHPRPIWVID